MRVAAGVVSVILAGAAPAAAQTLPAQDDFTFRRVKVPEPGTVRRITVQIDPAEQARRLAMGARPRDEPDGSPADAPPQAGGAAGAPPVGDAARYDWFWETVPTARAEVQGRFSLAMATLGQGPGGSSVDAPRLQALQDIASDYGIEILRATLDTEVSPALVLAVIGIESAGRPDAVSAAGAQGLMQLIPETAVRFGVTDSTDPAQNIRGGVAYLDWLMKRFDRDPLMVLAAYNAGEGAVEANAGVPPFAETRDYVPKVLAAWQVAQGLCQTPPELVSDPCVFKVISASD